MYETSGYEELNKANILSKITEYDIFRYYIKDFKSTGRKFCSELRQDVHPSCSIKVLPSGIAIYKDFASGETYNAFSYVQKKYTLNFYEALNVISNDFNLGLHSPSKTPVKSMGYEGVHITKQPKFSTTEIRIVSKDFSSRGENYWLQYGITTAMLQEYNVKEISHYYINKLLITIPNKEIGFAYHFGNYKYKILRPFNQEWKWVTNSNAEVVQGLSQIPKTGGFLFITKSLKDVMTLRTMGYYAIAPQSENTEIPSEIITKLKSCWDEIVIYYDNDIPGMTAAKEHSSKYGLPFICNPICVEKDSSDYYKKNGRKKLDLLIQNLIKHVQGDIYTV